DRAAPRRAARPLALLAAAGRDEPDVLPDALRRADGHAAPDLPLPARSRLGRLEPPDHDRRLRAGGGDGGVLRERAPEPPARRAGRPRPVGRPHAGVGPPVPAPALQLRRAAAGPPP